MYAMIGMDVVATGCGIGHSKESLCCKASIEYWQYLNTTKESGELYRYEYRKLS